MAFELRLTFSGLTALVPNKDAGEPMAAANEWIVVMPALRSGEQSEENGKKIAIAPHQAMLSAKALAVKKHTKEPRLRVRNPQSEPDDEQSDLLFQIDREVLEIDAGKKGLEVHFKDPAVELPDPGQLRDLKWVPQINKCLDGGVPFDGSLIDRKTLRHHDSLAGVVRLDRGTLETVDVQRGGGDEVMPYEFRRSLKGKPLFRQALAKGFRLRVEVPGDTANLILTDYQGNPAELVVGPYDDCPRNEKDQYYVEVKVLNQEMEEILGLGVDPDDAERGDTDFVIFYRLSSVWPKLTAGDLALPYLAKGGGGGRSKPCEPPQYPGFG